MSEKAEILEKLFDYKSEQVNISIDQLKEIRNKVSYLLAFLSAFIGFFLSNNSLDINIEKIIFFFGVILVIFESLKLLKSMGLDTTIRVKAVKDEEVNNYPNKEYIFDGLVDYLDQIYFSAKQSIYDFDLKFNRLVNYTFLLVIISLLFYFLDKNSYTQIFDFLKNNLNYVFQ